MDYLKGVESTFLSFKKVLLEFIVKHISPYTMPFLLFKGIFVIKILKRIELNKEQQIQSIFDTEEKYQVKTVSVVLQKPTESWGEL